MKDRYNIFKAVLIDRFAPSSRQQSRNLLKGVQLDNHSPSKLFRHMRKLAGKDADSQLVLELWSTALPSTIQEMLTVCCDEQTGEAQARVSDRLYARHREDGPKIAAISISSDMGRRDDETSPSRYHRYRGHGDTRAIRVRSPPPRQRPRSPASSPRRAYSARGPPHCTWFLRSRMNGAHAGITKALISPQSHWFSVRIRPFSISDEPFGHHTNSHNDISLCYQWHG